MNDEQKNAIDHAQKILRAVKRYDLAELLSASIADTAKPVIDKSMVKRLMVQHGLDKSHESIADTAGAKPVAWQETDVYWNPLEAFSTREDAFAYQRPLYAAPPAPSVADAAGAKPDDDEPEPTPESDRAARNATTQFMLIRCVQLWRAKQDMKDHMMWVFNWLREQGISGKALGDSTVKLAAPPAPSVADAAGASEQQQFEAWAIREGLISESHGVRFINSMCDTAKKAWQARALLAAGASEGQTEPVARWKDRVKENIRKAVRNHYGELTHEYIAIDLLLAGEINDETDGLLRLLAECREACPIPESGSNAEGLWAAAIGNPGDVPGYVAASIAALRERIAGMEKDAQRYRFLREQDDSCEVFCMYGRNGTWGECGHMEIYGVLLDETVDAAIAKEKQG